MALGNSILSSNNLAELEDNLSTLGTSVMLGAGPTATNFRRQVRNNYQDTLTKNRSFSTLQISQNDKKTKTLKNSQQQLKMATSATIGKADASTLDRLDRRYAMEQINQSMPMYRSRPAVGQNAYAGNYSTLFHKDDAFLTKGSFAKYGTIQNPAAFDQLATIAGPPYGARQQGGFSSLLKTNVGIYPRNYRAGASGANNNLTSAMRTLSTAPMSGAQAYMDEVKQNQNNLSMLFGGSRPGEATLSDPNSPFKDTFQRNAKRSSRTLQQAEREWLCRF